MTQARRTMTAFASAIVAWAAACGGDGSSGLQDATVDAEVAVDSGVGIDSAAPDAGPADAAPPADTWTNFAETFFSAYCTQCHFGPPRDYRTIDEVVRDLATIRCGVSPGPLADCGPWPPPRQFPIGNGPFPSDAERQRIVDWIEAGLPP